MSTERSDREPLLNKQQQQQYGSSAKANSAKSSDSEVTIITSAAPSPKPTSNLPDGGNIVFILTG
jgi:hypothetical protein